MTSRPIVLDSCGFKNKKKYSRYESNVKLRFFSVNVLDNANEVPTAPAAVFMS